MDCFAKKLTNNQLLSVIYQPHSVIKIQIEISNALYQTCIYSNNIPRFFSSIHIRSLEQVYQKLKLSIKQDIDLFVYLDTENQQIGLKISVKLLSTGDIIQKKVLLQTSKFIKSKSNSGLQQTIKKIVKQEFQLLKQSQIKEISIVNDKIEEINFDLKTLRDQMAIISKRVQGFKPTEVIPQQSN